MSHEEFGAVVASRAEIQRASKFGGHTTHVNTITAVDEPGLRAMYRRELRTVGCTNLDHTYPLTVQAGDPCFCGARKWGEVGAPRRRTQIAVESTPTTAPTSEVTPDTSTKEGMNVMITLKRRAILGGGLVAYSLEGVRGSLTVSKSMFSDPSNPPETLDITTEGFAQPDAATNEKKAKLEATRAEREATRNARKAEAIAAAQKRADAARERAEKQAKLAAAAAARLAKLAGGTSAAEPVAEPAEPVAEVETVQ
jgi:hypothetical protein